MADTPKVPLQPVRSDFQDLDWLRARLQVNQPQVLKEFWTSVGRAVRAGQPTMEFRGGTFHVAPRTPGGRSGIDPSELDMIRKALRLPAVAGSILLSASDVMGRLGVGEERFKGTDLYSAYNSNLQANLPEPYRNMNVVLQRPTARAKTRAEPYFSKDTLPLLAQYFHVVDPTDEDAYLAKKEVRDALRKDHPHIKDQEFEEAWTQLDKRGRAAKDGEPFMLNKKELTIGVKTKGALKTVHLHEDSVDMFAAIVQQGIDPIGGGFASSIAASRGGRKR